MISSTYGTQTTPTRKLEGILAGLHANCPSQAGGGPPQPHSVSLTWRCPTVSSTRQVAQGRHKNATPRLRGPRAHGRQGPAVLQAQDPKGTPAVTRQGGCCRQPSGSRAQTRAGSAEPAASCSQRPAQVCNYKRFLLVDASDLPTTDNCQCCVRSGN